MKLSERIQYLRKQKGCSQEELADKIGVSRQAVSKWESEQALPDLDKIILISEFFDVTTDYLLKGTEPVQKDAPNFRDKPNTNIFLIVGTAFNLMGIIISSMVWYEKRSAAATAAGLVFIVLGCMVWDIGTISCKEKIISEAWHTFLFINIWTIMFIPLSVLCNMLGYGVPAPYPLIVNPPVSFVLFWLVYFAVGIITDFKITKRKNRS